MSGEIVCSHRWNDLKGYAYIEGLPVEYEIQVCEWCKTRKQRTDAIPRIVIGILE